jgi:lipopolysaccharide transport system permease protein/teichoic acid transport system permease protein
MVGLRGILKDYKLILEMAKKDFEGRYLGSYLGVIWGFVQPLVQILIFWFVFQVGFKSLPVDKFSFILWLSSAMIPWFFVSDAIHSGTNSVIENSYLVKKMVFKVWILPLIKIHSALFVHLFFILFLVSMFAIYGYYPNHYYIQIIYYLAAGILLVTGISYLTSSLVVFLKDVGHFVSMFLQFGFWLTPIFYSIDIIPEKFQFLIKLNPAVYIIEGYRDSFMYHEWFWEHPKTTMLFWIETLIFCFVGVWVFRKTRSRFADVL